MIRPEETEIVGNWIVIEGSVKGDDRCDRIEELTRSYLERLGPSPESGGWDTLFRDPTDGRFWERLYLQSYMHGGGPPALKVLSDDEAKEKYPQLLSEME